MNILWNFLYKFHSLFLISFIHLMVLTTYITTMPKLLQYMYIIHFVSNILERWWILFEFNNYIAYTCFSYRQIPLKHFGRWREKVRNYWSHLKDIFDFHLSTCIYTNVNKGEERVRKWVERKERPLRDLFSFVKCVGLSPEKVWANLNRFGQLEDKSNSKVDEFHLVFTYWLYFCYLFICLLLLFCWV